MGNLARRPADGTSATFTLDRAYIRTEARSALATLLAPLAGVVKAAKGKSTEIESSVTPVPVHTGANGSSDL